MSSGELVIVDSREPVAIADQLRTYGFQVTIGQLNAGDYCFFPHGLKVIIERKRNDDLLNSLRDGRMVSQVHKLLDEADVVFLLREGPLTRTPTGQVAYQSKGDRWLESGWSWESYSSMMLDLQLMGLIIHDCFLGESPREIARLVGSLSKDQHNWIRSRTRPPVITIDPQWRNAVWSLCAFEGVGPEWAESLLNNRGSLASVVAANEEALALVKNKKGQSFGPKRAMKLKEEFLKAYG